MNKDEKVEPCEHPMSSREGISPVDRSERCGLCGMTWSDPMISVATRPVLANTEVREAVEVVEKMRDEQLGVLDIAGLHPETKGHSKRRAHALTTLLAAVSRPDECVWNEADPDSEYGPQYESKCGVAFDFIDDGVEANGFKFCYSCGKKIVVQKYVAEEGS